MKYVVFDKKSDVYTPSGNKYTADQWLNKYQWAKKSKMVLSGGAINGSFIMVFDDLINEAKKNGVDFTNCKSDQDMLNAIEIWEDEMKEKSKLETENQNANNRSVQERIAEALEDLVIMNALAMEEAEVINESTLESEE